MFCIGTARYRAQIKTESICLSVCMSACLYIGLSFRLLQHVHVSGPKVVRIWDFASL